MRNPHVLYLDVQSAGSLGGDGQSVCELQAALSVLSQLLSSAIRLPGCRVSVRWKRTLLFIVPSRSFISLRMWNILQGFSKELGGFIEGA